MRIASHLSLTAAFIGIAACGGGNAGVIMDFDPEASFDGFRTFGLLAGGSGLEEDRLDVEQIEGFFEAAIEAALVEKGYVRATDGNPDFMIGYHIGLDGALSVQRMNTGYQYSAGWGWSNWGLGNGPTLLLDTDRGGSEEYGQYYDEGTVVLDVMNHAARRLVWRAAVRGPVDMNAIPSERRRAVNRVVRQLFQDFPPD